MESSDEKSNAWNVSVERLQRWTARTDVIILYLEPDRGHKRTERAKHEH